MRAVAAALLLVAGTAVLGLAGETTGSLPRSDAPVAPPAASTPSEISTFTLTVGTLKGRPLTGPRSGELGNIDLALERSSDGARFLAVRRGGVLGLLRPDVIIPLHHMAFRDGRVVADLTEDQIAALPHFEKSDDTFRVLDDDQSISLADAGAGDRAAQD